MVKVAALRGICPKEMGNDIMRTKLIITTAALLGLAAPAHAQLFTPGGTYNFNIQNSPGTSNNLVTFTPGTQLIDGGDVALTLTIVNAANFATTGAQWVVLQTQTVGGVALSQPDEDWSISAVGLPAAIPINFIADYSQWTDTSGANIAQTNHIFNQPLISNPVPGMTGTGEGSSGFASPIAVGPAFPLGGFSPLQSSELNDVAASLDATPMQVALAWLLHRSPNILLIPGTSSVEHLRENLNATKLELAPEVIAQLDSIGKRT